MVVELLVLLVLIVLLVGLLFPTVLRLREASQRLRCSSNLQQIGLALHQHHDAQIEVRMVQHADNSGTWLRRIMPFLNCEPTQCKLPTVCPADPRAGNVYDGSAGMGRRGLSWYVASDYQHYGDALGVLAHHDARQLLQCDAFDGLSHTIMVAERIPSIQGTYADLYWGWWDYPTDYDTRTPVRALHGLYSLSGTRSGNQPCTMPAPMQPADHANQCAFNAPTSFHANGANFLMGDGSVRWLTVAAANQHFVGPQGESLTLLQTLGSRHRHESFEND